MAPILFMTIENRTIRKPNQGRPFENDMSGFRIPTVSNIDNTITKLCNIDLVTTLSNIDLVNSGDPNTKHLNYLTIMLTNYVIAGSPFPKLVHYSSHDLNTQQSLVFGS